MAGALSPFLSFAGQARDALALYRCAFPFAELREETAWPQGGPAGLRMGRLAIGETELRLIDQPGSPDFGFTPGLSLFVALDAAAEVDAAAAILAEAGKVMMPPDSYDFAARFAWVADRFGVNWQLCHGLA